jgi:hypothetical protein
MVSHRTQQCGIDARQPRQRLGIQAVIFPRALADQSHIPGVGHNDFVTKPA